MAINRTPQENIALLAEWTEEQKRIQAELMALAKEMEEQNKPGLGKT